ncbi:GNS1/SUR4 domain containing protein [Plasmodium ovale wallikeri]|uniref:GNS1/SUR4 domain containing protein n=1 Tax=Plasmodium ovale wallikeri TaxID=864142 RepID=A0A1A8YQ00_PLAOA|nr:GNS1/SUR4 domain containing protein [Plasmodium ovale wallikeri]
MSRSVFTFERYIAAPTCAYETAHITFVYIFKIFTQPKCTKTRVSLSTTMGAVSRAYWSPGKGKELAVKYEKTILLISLLYIPAILILQKIMKNRKEIEAKFLKILWNVSLSLLSLIGVLFIIIYDRNVLKYVIIEETEYSPETRAVITIFTLTKYTHTSNYWFYNDMQKNKIAEKNFTEQSDIFNKYKKKYYSNMAILKKITINMIKTFLLCFNGLVTYAHDNIFLFVNFYSKKIKKIANDSIIMDNKKGTRNGDSQSDDVSSSSTYTSEQGKNGKKKKKKKKTILNFYILIRDLYNSSIISYIISKSPIENISLNLEKTMKSDKQKLHGNCNLFYIIKQLFQNYLLYIVCLILPIYYGLKVYNDALLGLCVHGALRWIIEIYSTKIFNKTSKLSPY